MLLISKNRLTETSGGTSLEVLNRDNISLEGWFSDRKNKKLKEKNREKLLEIIGDKRQIATEKDLDRAIDELEKELVEAYKSLGADGSGDIIKQFVDDERNTDRWMGTRFKKRPPKDFKTIIKHRAYVSLGAKSISYIPYMPVPVQGDVVPFDIVYQTQDLIVSITEGYKGQLSLLPEQLWYFDFTETRSKTREKVVEEVRVGLREHLMHVYRTLDEEAVWTDKDGHVNYDFDLVARVEEPNDAVFAYDRVIAEYPDGGGNSSFIVEHLGETIIIDVDHEMTAITVH